MATAVVSVLVAALSAIFSTEWALGYAAVATLAWFNWFALAKIGNGIIQKNLLDLLIGLMIKPLLLVLVLIYGLHVGVEITSFLAGIKTFWLVLFAYMALKAMRGTLIRTKSAGGTEAHG